MITLTGVTKEYSTSSSQVLQNVNFKLNKGDFVYVVGDSGAGKTTLLKMLFGEEIPTRGAIEVFGIDVGNANTNKLQQLRRKMGVIFQDLRLIEELTAFDNVALSLEINSDRKALQNGGLKKATEDALKMVNLHSAMKKRVKDLSGGERQRVAAARAIVHSPEILIADEPTGSLDREHTWVIMDIIQKLHLRGTTVLVATHDRDIVRRIRRRSFVLKSGKLAVEDGVCMF